MRKAKRGPALFEVLSDEADSTDHLKVPGWWAGQDRGSSRGVIKLASSRPARSAVQQPTPVPETTDDGETLPVISFADGRLRLSLTSTYAAIGVFVGLIVVISSYEAGSRSGFVDGVAAGKASFMADAANEIEQARLQEPATQVVASLLQDAPENSSVTAKLDAGGNEAGIKPNWIQGFTYIVAQEFSSGREEDAKRAQAFLAGEGVDTALITMASGSSQLITTRGFNYGDSTQRTAAVQFLQREHEIGEKYFAQGGSYRLKGYFKKLTGDRW